MKFRILFLGLLSAALFGCKQNQKNEETPAPTKMEQVIAIHDEVMPKMSTISKLAGELKPMADSTEAGSEYDQALKDLQAAHQSMMDWMKGFGDRFDSEEVLHGKALTEEKQKWLEEEEVKVKAMKDQVETSIRNAESLLQRTQ